MCYTTSYCTVPYSTPLHSTLLNLTALYYNSQHCVAELTCTSSQPVECSCSCLLLKSLRFTRVNVRLQSSDTLGEACVVCVCVWWVCVCVWLSVCDWMCVIECVYVCMWPCFTFCYFTILQFFAVSIFTSLNYFCLPLPFITYLHLSYANKWSNSLILIAYIWMPIYAGSCSLGAAAECFEIAVKYSKERSQFGKPIAHNQK